MAVDQSVRIRVKSEGVKQATAGLSSIKKAALGVGVALGGISIARAFTGGVRLVAEFGDRMAQVQAVSGATAEQIKAIEAEAKRLGATTRFTASEAAEGFIELARAGQGADESIKNAGIALNFAQANAIGLQEATLQLVNVSNQFGVDFQKAADIVSTGAASAATTANELGEAFSYAGSQARTAGVSLETTTAVLGVLANNGIKASSAGTALTRLFTDLQKITPKSQRALDRAGVSAEDMLKAFREDNLDQLAKYLKQIIASGENLNVFGQRAARITPIIARNGEALVDVRKKMETASGQTAEMARIMDDTLLGSLRGLRSAFEAVALDIGQKLEPAFKGLVVVMRGLLISSEEARTSMLLSSKASAGLATAVEVLREAVKLATITSVAFLAVWGAKKIPAAILGIKSMALAAKGLTASMVAARVAAGPFVALLSIIGYAAFKFSPKLRKFASDITGIGKAGKETAKELNEVAKAATKAAPKLDETGMKATQVGKGLKVASAEAKKTKVTLEDLASAQESVNDASYSAGQAFSKLSQQLNPVKISLEEAREGVQSIRGQLTELSIGLEEARAAEMQINEEFEKGNITKAQKKAALEALSKEYEKSRKEIGKLTDAYGPYRKALKEAEKDVVALGKAREKANASFAKELKALEQNIGDWGTEQNKAILSEEQLKEKIVETEKELAKFPAAIEHVKREMESLREERDAGRISSEAFTRDIEDQAAVLEGLGERFDMAKDKHEKFMEQLKEKNEEGKNSFEDLIDTIDGLLSSFDSLETVGKGLGFVGLEEGEKRPTGPQTLKAFGNFLGDTHENLKGIGEAFDVEALKGGFGSLLDLLKGGSKHGGGIVPGKPGENVPTMLSAGEAVFNPTQIEALSRLFQEQGRALRSGMGGGGMMRGPQDVQVNVLNQARVPITASVRGVSQSYDGGVRLNMLVRDIVQSEMARGG